MNTLVNTLVNAPVNAYAKTLVNDPGNTIADTHLNSFPPTRHLLITQSVVLYVCQRLGGESNRDIVPFRSSRAHIQDASEIRAPNWFPAASLFPFGPRMSSLFPSGSTVISSEFQ